MRLRSFFSPVIGVFLISLVVRVCWTHASALELLGDFYCYERSAQHWVETGEYRLLPWNAPVFVANRPPGYTGFVALNYLVFGRDIKAVGYVQAILGALTSTLVAAFASRVVSRRVAVCAGLLHALWLPAVVYVPILASVNLALPLLLGSLVLTQRAEQKAGRGRYTYLAIAGVLFGLVLLARSATMFIMPAWLLLALRGGASHRRRLASLLVCFAAVGVTLTPWLIRNYLVGFGFPTFATQGGRVLWWGNNPRTVDGGTGAPFTTPAEWALPEQAAAAVWHAKGIRWIRENPGRYAGLCAIRVIRFFGTEVDVWLVRYLDPRPAAQEAFGARNWHIKTGRPATQEQIDHALYVLGRNAKIARAWRVIFAPLMLLALVLALCRPRKYVYVLLPLAAYIGGLALTAFAERYRILSDPLLLILFAALLCDVFAGATELGRRPSRVLKIGLAVAVLAVSVIARTTGLDESWYELPAVPQPAPDVSQFAFTEIDLRPGAGARCTGARYTNFQHVEDGVRCEIAYPEQKEVSPYGGTVFPVPGLPALRLEVSFEDPRNIAVVFVDALDENGQLAWRWVWQKRPSGYNLPSEQPQTYIFARGQRSAHFRPIGEHPDVPIKEARVMIRVEPGTKAAFVLHRVEAATRTVPDDPSE